MQKPYANLWKVHPSKTLLHRNQQFRKYFSTKFKVTCTHILVETEIQTINNIWTLYWFENYGTILLLVLWKCWFTQANWIPLSNDLCPQRIGTLKTLSHGSNFMEEWNWNNGVLNLSQDKEHDDEKRQIKFRSHFDKNLCFSNHYIFFHEFWNSIHLQYFILKNSCYSQRISALT